MRMESPNRFVFSSNERDYNVSDGNSPTHTFEDRLYIEQEIPTKDNSSLCLNPNIEVKSEPEEYSVDPLSVVKTEIEDSNDSNEVNSSYKVVSSMSEDDLQGCDTEVSKEGRILFKCFDCGKAFERKDKCLIHIRTHTGEKPFECLDCGKVFSQKSHLNEHKKVHTGERNFKCEECGNKFCYRSSLKRHMNLHTREKLFKCPDCGKTFNRKGRLDKHYMLHSGEKPFRCSVCGKGSSRKQDHDRHMTIHTGEKSFQCSVCGKSFSRLQYLRKHMKVHKE